MTDLEISLEWWLTASLTA